MSSSTPRIAILFKLSAIIGRRRLQGVFDYLLQKQAKWDIRLPQNEEDLIRELNANPDGVIAAHVSSEAILRQLEHCSIPVVFMDIPMSDRRQMRTNDVTVHNDNGGIGIMAANYLLKIGRFNAYGIYSSPPPRDFSRRRSAAFTSTLQHHGHTTNIFDPNTEDLPEWLDALPKPAAVFATCDEMARDVLLAAHKKHIRIPEQLALLGADDDEIICKLLSPELSSIRIHAEREGYTAAEELHRILMGRGHGQPKFRLIKPLGVCERQSTKSPPPATVLVNRALDFIRASAVRGITPSDVARHVGCSRRLLDLRFQQLHTRSIQSEITAVRLEAVCRKLTRTNNTIESIAADCGFPSTGSLRNLFLTTYGISMRAFRRR